MKFEKPTTESNEPAISSEETQEIQKNKVILKHWSVMNEFSTEAFSRGFISKDSRAKGEANKISAVEFPQGGRLYLNPEHTLYDFREAGLTPENHELVKALSEYQAAKSLPRRTEQEDGSWADDPNYKTSVESARKSFKDMLDKYKPLLTGAY